MNVVLKGVSREEVRQLIEQGGTPWVSFFLAPYPPGETLQRAVQLENLLRRAEAQLETDGYERDDMRAMLAPVREMTDARTLEPYQDAGLAIYVAPGQFYLYQVPHRVSNAVVMGRRPYIKPLLIPRPATGSFYVLALSKNRARLLHATPSGITPVPLPDAPEGLDDLPQTDPTGRQAQRHVTRSMRGGASGAMYPGHGGNIFDEKVEVHRYLQAVSNAVERAMNRTRDPLVLAGVEYMVSMYRSLNGYAHVIDGHISGSPDHLSDEALCERGINVLMDHLNRLATDERDRFEALLQYNPPRASANLRTILPAAHAGRIERLLIASDQQVWGRYNPDEETVSLHDEPLPGDDDLLDVAAHQTVLHNGEAIAVTAAEIPGSNGVAAVFRY
ncbi:MAG: baeRF7 domain-containing protein [Roseiflexus sp.]